MHLFFPTAYMNYDNSLEPPEMNTSQLLLVSSLGLAVNLFGMFAMGGHHHHVRSCHSSCSRSHSVVREAILTHMGTLIHHMITVVTLTLHLQALIRTLTPIPRHPLPSSPLIPMILIALTKQRVLNQALLSVIPIPILPLMDIQELTMKATLTPIHLRRTITHILIPWATPPQRTPMTIMRTPKTTPIRILKCIHIRILKLIRIRTLRDTITPTAMLTVILILRLHLPTVMITVLLT